MAKKIIPTLVMFVLFLAGCNFPGVKEDPAEPVGNAVLTAAAETVAAALEEATSTQVVEIIATDDQSQTETPKLPEPTATHLTAGTITPLPTDITIPTKTSSPCNMATFVKDVTIPDDTELEPGETFTKTWRLKNLGTCSWTSDYDLVFDDGDVMGGDTETILTNGTVAPGQTVDVSIVLKAPDTEGTYRGNWRLRDDNNVIFGLTTGKSFWVQIKVVEPADIHQVTLLAVANKSGSVLRDGTERPEKPWVGDTVGPDKGSQAFISFDISGIPDDATITEVRINFSDYAKVGDPFNDLGCLHAYAQSYQPLDGGDYTPPTTTNGLVYWCSKSKLDSGSLEEKLKDQLQSELIGSWLQLRLQFKDKHDDGDGSADMIKFDKDNMKLIVKYTTP